jgi:hypothetical protein
MTPSSFSLCKTSFKTMSLTPFHLSCPFTDLPLCRCEKYISKGDIKAFAENAQSVYQYYIQANPAYAEEFKQVDTPPTITHRVVVNSKTAGIREQPVFQSPIQQQQRNVNPVVQQPSPALNFANPSQQALMRLVNTNVNRQAPQRPPPLPQPSAQKPFNNSNIKIISAAGTAPTPTKETTGPRTAKKEEETKKRIGRPRREKKPVCDECGEGEEDEEKDPNMLQCDSCKLYIHTYCHDPKLDHLAPQYKENWRCEDCKICTTCDEAGDEEKLLICEQCDRGFHTYCLQPPLETIPSDSWTCAECGTTDTPTKKRRR